MASTERSPNVAQRFSIWMDRQRRRLLIEACRLDEKQVDEALLDLAAGTYGNCQRCGCAIDRDYLAAYPWARLCGDCRVSANVIQFRHRNFSESFRDRLEVEGGKLLLQAKGPIAQPGLEPAPTFEDELAALLPIEDRARLQQIKDALARIDDGTYGTCEECAQPIPFERLDTEPWAARCARCQPRGKVLRFRRRANRVRTQLAVLYQFCSGCAPTGSGRYLLTAAPSNNLVS